MEGKPGLTLLPKVELELEVREGGPEGHVRERKRFAGNLATTNLVDLMRKLWTTQESGGSRGATLTDVDGNDRTVRAYDTGEDGFFTAVGANHRAVIGDGGGATVMPDPSNHQLDNELDRVELGQPSSAGSDAFDVSATFGNDTGAAWTVREVGILHEWGGEEYGSNGNLYLSWHDAVGDTTVPDGDAVTVRWRFTWP